MQSTDDIQAKTSRKKPKPNNKTKTLSKQRPGEDFKSRACSLNRKFNCSERSTSKLEEVSDTIAINTKILQNNVGKPTNKANENSLSDINPSLVKNSILDSQKEMNNKSNLNQTMSREEILAARQNKKNAKKNKTINTKIDNSTKASDDQNKFSKESEKETVSLCEKPTSQQMSSVQDVEESIKDLTVNNKLTEKIENSKTEKNMTEKNNSEINKSREEVMAERQAKKLAKQAKKNNKLEATPAENTTNATNYTTDNKSTSGFLIDPDKSKIQNSKNEMNDKKSEQATLVENNTNGETSSCAIMSAESRRVIVTEKKPLSKAERRALQESQRAAKAKILEEKQKLQKKDLETVKKSEVHLKVQKTASNSQQSHHKLSSGLRSFTSEYKVKLFKHLDREDLQEKNQFINHPHIHPSIVQLGEQISSRTVVGSNARCISFLRALKVLIQDYQTPPKKEFTRGLEESINNCVQYLDKCRPIAVSVSNAHKAIQSVLRHLSNDSPESELKEHLCEHIDTYIRDQIEKAAQAISGFVQEKISEGDVILTYNCSSLIYQILEDAYNRKIDFKVIVVDSRPFLEGRELYRKLALKEIPCTYVLINAIGFIMPEVTKILMGAHALLANGNVMARTGTAQIALVAKSFNVPVLVCCETHKFSDRVQTDAIVYNELGNPDDLIMNDTCKLSNWRKGANKILPLNLNYDITPPELVTAVVTEVAILPCTSVPVILRLRPTDLY